MKLTIRSHNTTAFDDFQKHAEKRLARLDHLLPRVDDVVVEMRHEETRQAAHRYAVQVTVHAGASILRAEERGADPRVALDVVADTLAQQARRHRKRLHDRNHASVAKDAVAAAQLAPVGGPELDDEVDEYVLGRIVRAKHFEAKPMSQEEALAQMDLIGHDIERDARVGAALLGAQDRCAGVDRHLDGVTVRG